MAKVQVQLAAAARKELFFALDSSSTTGAGKTGASGTMSAYYVRNETTPAATAIASPAFTEVSSGNMPGVYYLTVPLGAFAAGATTCVVMITGTGMAPVTMEYQLVAYNPNSATNLGLSALPTATHSTAGGLITSGTGTAQLTTASGVVTVGSISAGAITAVSIATGAIDADALATDAVTEIVNGVWSRDPSDALFNGLAGYWLYQAGLNSQGIISDTNVIAGTAYIESIADTILGRNVGGGSNSGRLVKEALYALRNKSEIIGATLSVYDALDALSWTAVVASSSSADPVTGIDP